MSLLWIFIGVGGFIGGLVPLVFGASSLSLWGILTAGVGSVIGLVIYRRLDLE